MPILPPDNNGSVLTKNNGERMHVLRKLKEGSRSRGQSFVELAIILPLILIMLAGMVEVAFAMFAYLTALDLTREAARFASIRDYRELNVLTNPGPPPQVTAGLHFTPPPYGPPPDGSAPSNPDACADDELHYFYDTACFFVDPDLNPFLEFSADKYDDVTISVFTVTENQVTDRHPTADGGVWSLFNNNWTMDCQGNVVHNEPTFTNAEIESEFVANAPPNRGLVLVEAFVCYDMLLNFPVISGFIPSPMRIHAYTVMPAAEAVPTPTPIPVGP